MTKTSSLAERGDVRETILEAAGRLLRRYGYKKMTVEDIAQEAGIGKGTIYLYFPSKEEVALGWMDDSALRNHERLRKIAASDGAPRERLCRMLIERVMLRFDGAQDLLGGLDELFASIRPALLARRSRIHEAEAMIFAEVLEQGRRDEVFAFDDLSATARALLLATNALLPYSLSAVQLGRRAEIKASVTRIAELLLYGLLRREGETQ